MKQLTSNLSQYWNLYIAAGLMILLAILKDSKVLTPDAVSEIQYILLSFGILPTKGRSPIRLSRRAVSKTVPFLLLFFLFNCKPAPKPTPGDVARVQVKEQITRTYEKVVVAVDAMPDDELSKLVASDSETVKLFRQYYRENERAQ